MSLIEYFINSTDYYFSVDFGLIQRRSGEYNLYLNNATWSCEHVLIVYANSEGSADPADHPQSRKYSLFAHTIWATSWENQFMPYANDKGADQRLCCSLPG